MIFRDDKQISKVCMVLLSYTNKTDLWVENGPSDVAIELCEAKGGYLSSGEWALLAFCFALWNGDGGGTMKQLFQLDLQHRNRIGSLLQCSTTTDTDVWIDKNEKRNLP